MIPDRIAASAAGLPRGRLTDQERADRAMTEAQLQDLITDLGALLGWEWLHIRPGMKANGRWWTATTGTLSRWPDLVLVRIRDHRLIFAELKRELEQPTGDQARVLDVLRELVFNRYKTSPALGFNCLLIPQVEVHVWRPSDIRDPVQDSAIGRILR